MIHPVYYYRPFEGGSSVVFYSVARFRFNFGTVFLKCVRIVLGSVGVAWLRPLRKRCSLGLPCVLFVYCLFVVVLFPASVSRTGF